MLDTASRLEIRVLGPLEVSVDGAPLAVDTRKALAILAILAVEGRPFAREELAALLWPEANDDSARGALRRTLSVLRAALRGRWVTIDRTTVALDRSGTWLDLDVLGSGTASDEPGVVADAAHAARGPFLAGFTLRDSADFDDWRATRAVAVERQTASVLDRLAELAEASGDVAAATAAATRRVELDPLDEPAQRRLIALLARAGDRSGAVRQYRACVAVLERELGVAPLAETTELYEAIRDDRLGSAPAAPVASAVATPARAPVASAGPASVPMVGREAGLATLLVAHARAGADPVVMLVTGEAGVGKTRLIEAASDEVRARGGRVARARAFMGERSVAYAPVIELLRRLLDAEGAADRLRALDSRTLHELGRLVALPGGSRDSVPPEAGAPDPSEPAGRARLLDAISDAVSALAGGEVPGLVTVEDLQWADDASREALLYLGRRLGGARVALVLSWRPEDLDPAGIAFSAGAEALPGEVSVPLARLDWTDVAELVAALPDAGAVDIDTLVAESEGLPLYIVEALAAGAAPGASPGRGMRALLRERLATVGEAASQVLSAAAVIGRTFDFELVRATGGRSEDETLAAVEELVRRGIVRELEAVSEPAFDFSHARLREAAYEATSLARRRLLHRRTADALRADPAHRQDPGRLARIAAHERDAGRDAAAVEAFWEAGRAARSLHANRAAADHFEAALALGHPDPAGLQLELGRARTAAGDYAGAIAALEAAAALATGDRLPAIELQLGRTHALRGDTATAASHLDEAIGLLDARDDGGLLSTALVERAVVARRAGAATAAISAAGRALELATAVGDDAASGAAHRMLGLAAYDAGDLARARQELGRSLDLVATNPDPGAAIAAHNGLALVEAGSGDHEAAIAHLETALEACRRIGEPHLEAAVENNLADQLQAAGRSDEAMEHLKRAVSLFADVGGRPGELEPEIWKLVAW